MKPISLQLEKKRAENEAICSELRSQIINLWDWLKISDEERNAFAVHMVGSRAKTLQMVSIFVCVYVYIFCC